MSKKVQLSNPCEYCSKIVTYTAKSKAEAQRMKSARFVCQSQPCRDKDALYIHNKIKALLN